MANRYREMSQGEITKSFLTFSLKIPLSTIRENTAVFWWYFPVCVCVCFLSRCYYKMIIGMSA